MTKNSTTPQKAIEEAQKQRAAAEQAAADMEARLAGLAKQRAELDATEERLRLDRLQALQAQQAAEQAEIQAARLVEPARVTRLVAEEVAQQVLVAFEHQETIDRMAERPESLTSDQLWSFIDATRGRLLTSAVDADARELVLAVEAVLLLCDRWEHHRSGGATLDTEPTGEGLGADPRFCRAVTRILRDLRQTLDGEPARKIESIGTLLSEGIEFGQIAKMMGMISPAGDIDRGAFGTLVDLGASPGPSRLSWRWLGAWSLDAAWTKRQQLLPGLRERHAEGPGPGAGRLSGTGVLRRRADEEESERGEFFLAAQLAYGDEPETDASLADGYIG